MELLELLENADVEGFNAQRTDNGKLDFFAADLAEKNLAGIDLSRANLDKSDLTGADLSDSTLLGARLSGIDGSGMKLVSTLAIRSKFKEAWMDEADLTEGDFTRSNFSEANLEGSVATGVVFAGARLVEVNAKNASWTDADLVEAALHKIDLTGADLRRADLSEASGAEAVFVDVKLDGAVGTHARFQGCDFSGSSLVGARFLGANLAGANFTGADLSNADLSGANLAGAVLAGAKLKGAVLADAVLDGVVMAGLDLTGVDLSGVDPTPLSLSAEQLDQVSMLGVEVPLELPLEVKRAQAATAGGVTAVLWENQDSEESTSLRFAVFGKKVVRGVVQVPADKALARTIGPDGDGFRMAVLRERPGGVALVCYRLEADGSLSSATSTPLGYEPMVWPVLVDDGGVALFGLARRGPTLAVHRPTDEGLPVVATHKIATARGFLGKHHPVVACKGDVVQAASAKSAGAPRRTPDGFPGPLGTAAPCDDRILCVWVLERVGDASGGLRFAWLEPRGAPETEMLTMNDSVLSLDVLGVGSTCWIAWVELTPDGSRAFACSLPNGTIEPMGADVEALRAVWAPGGTGKRPNLVITRPGGGLAVVDAKGAVRTLD